MPVIEIRRHCATKKGEDRGKGSHLSALGVAHARQIGVQIGPCDRVLTSALPRTLETAVAMGFAVDDQWPELGDIPVAVWNEIGHHERWDWHDPFGTFAQVVAQGGATAQLGQLQQACWLRAAATLPAPGKVLIISHGRVIEAGLVACFPTADMRTWGRPFQHGEGVVLDCVDHQLTLRAFRREHTPLPEDAQP